LHGIIFPRAKQAIRTYHPQFQTLFQEYIDKKRADGLSEDTLKSYEIYLGRFSDYLNSRGIGDIRDMNEIVVLGFTDTFIRYSPSIIHNTLCSLRTFFHYLFQNGFASKDFAYIVPHDRYRQRTKVPSAYSKEDVETLLKSIARGNPKGKRDYAMILLAARLGLRAQDICDLSFNNLKWETNTIELLQEKTEEPIVLPLLENVGLAIIDYLKYARPEYESTNAIFLRLAPPLGKLEAPTLHSIVTQHMRTAGIKTQDGKKHGPHALRHSLASALLEENTPLPVISEILGHTNTASTSVYLKIDVNQLRTCSLEPPPFDWNKGPEVF
jgi:site-specific recombinase XerD